MTKPVPVFVKHKNGKIIYKVKKRIGNTLRVYGFPYSLYFDKVVPCYPTGNINESDLFNGFM